MTYALVVDGVVKEFGALPESARRVDTGEWVMGLARAPKQLIEKTGWLEVVEEPKPDDTASLTYDMSVQVINGVPTVTWIERQKTPAELEANTQRARREAQAARLKQAVDELRGFSNGMKSTTATQANMIQVLNKTLGELSVTLDRFADLIELQYEEIS